jgi:hypothetical protein
MSRTATAARMAEHAAADQDRAAIIGKARSHVAWALAAAVSGDLDDIIKYLERAADALGVTEPSPLYVPVGPSFARQHSEEAF